jgi:integrase
MKRRDGIRKRGEVWYIRLPLGNGKRQEEPTNAKSRKEAKKIRDKRLVEMREGRYEPDAAKTKVADLIEDLKRDYRVNGRNEKEVSQRWTHLERVFGNDLATAVTMTRLNKYVERRQADKAKPATIQRELAYLRRAFRLAFQAGKVFRVPPFPSIKVVNAREVFFEHDEFKRLLAELPETYIRPLATLAYWIGFRRGELLKLDWRLVDLDKGTIRLGVGTTKNKDGRLVYLPAEALAALEAWREHTTAVEKEHSKIIARVFHRDGEPVKSFPYVSWRAACERAKIPGRRPHDFRRTMARNYRRSGEAEGVIMKIGGWKTRSVFERYNIVAEDDLRRAAERVTIIPNSNGPKTGQVVTIVPAKSESGAS